MKVALNLPSLITGAAVALVLGLVMGFSPQATQVPAARAATAVATMGVNRPAARDIVCLEAKTDDRDPSSSNSIPGTGYPSAAFSVPAGRILILTGITSSSGSHYFAPGGIAPLDGFAFTIDGALKWIRAISGSFSVGIPLQSGQVVQLLQPTYTTGGASEHVWLHGYLEDA